MQSRYSIAKKTTDDSLTSAKASLESHILAFAAEESRLQKKTIALEEYRKSAFHRRSERNDPLRKQLLY